KACEHDHGGREPGFQMDRIAEEEAEVPLRVRLVPRQQTRCQRHEGEREQRGGEPAVRPRQAPVPKGSTTSKRPGSAITTRSASGSAWPGVTTSRLGTFRMKSISSAVSEMTSLHEGSEHSQESVTSPSWRWSAARVSLR